MKAPNLDEGVRADYTQACDYPIRLSPLGGYALWGGGVFAPVRSCGGGGGGGGGGSRQQPACSTQ